MNYYFLHYFTVLKLATCVNFGNFSFPFVLSKRLYFPSVSRRKFVLNGIQLSLMS
jgi:hypothetical protein